VTVTVSNVQVEFHLNPPLVTFLQGCDMTIAALQDAFREIEESEEGRAQPFNQIIKASGNENFNADGSVKNALTMTVLPPYEMKFEAGAVPFQTQIGNLLGTFVNSPGAIVQINNAVGALSLNSAAIEYSSFGGGVTVDVTSQWSGTENSEIGTPLKPVNNMVDGHAIASARGFGTFYIVGDVDLDDSVSSYEGHLFIGESPTKTTVTIDPSADVLGCEFYDSTLVGTLDGDSKLIDCQFSDLTYVNGTIERCTLNAGTVYLGGGVKADFITCRSGVPGQATPTIDLGGSGQSMTMRGYHGGIKLVNKTGTDQMSLDLDSGQVILGSTITAGEIVVRGVGKLIDENGDHIQSGPWNGATIVNETVNPETMAKQGNVLTIPFYMGTK
jgi:hypothetical protein